MQFFRTLINAIKGGSLAAQIIRTSIMVSIIAIATMGLGLIWIADHALRESTFRLQEESAQKVSLLISGYVRNAIGELELFERIESLPAMSPGEQKNALEKVLIHRQSLFSQIELISKQGNEMVKVSRFHTYLPHELVSKASSPAFLEAIAGRTYISPVFISADSGLLSVQIAVSVKDRRNNGVLIAEINISQLWQEVARLRIGRTGYAYLVDRKGRFIAYQEPAAILQRYGEDMQRIPVVADFMVDKRGRAQEYRGLNGESVIGTCEPIQGTAWAVIVELPAREAYASLYHMSWFLIGLTILVMAAVVGVGYGVALRLVRPIRALTAAVQRIGGGDLNAGIVEIRRHDEVGELARAFSQMQGELQSLYRGMEQQLEELKQAEQALKKSEEKYRELVENANSIILRMDKYGNINFFNEFAQQFFGYAEDEILGKNVIGTIVPEFESSGRDLKLLIEDIGRYPERYINNLNENMRSNGERVWIAWTNKPIRAADGEVVEILCIGNDITERKQAEEELSNSQRRLTDIIEFLPDATLVVDRQGRVIAWNRAMEGLTGIKAEEMIGKGDYGYALPFYGERRPILIDLALHPDLAWEKQYTTIGRSGDMIFGESYTPGLPPGDIHLSSTASVLRDARGDVIGAIECFRNNTERRRLETQLQQAQKMEAIGTLAGGIAHDFNNLLMTIQGNTSLLLMRTDPDDPRYDKLRTIENQVIAGADLTKQLLGFARAGRYEVKIINLNEILDKSAAMFGRTKKEIVIHKRYDQLLWMVEADTPQIEQVLLNLFVNAWQAMPGGGHIYLETANIKISESDEKSSYLKPGRYVRVSVTDTGVGMDEKTRERIFEPFFTTKEMGRGTGLGLAMVYGIIKGHNGHVNVYSEIGKGTVFNIYLPASTKEAQKEVRPEEIIFKGQETILLVDDERSIVDVIEEILIMLGYKVLTATAGQEALRIYEANKDMIDLVILDMILPEMGGGEIFDRLKEINPSVKVILSSGYTLNGEASGIIARGCLGFIQKPVNIAELSHKIRDVLG